jgi:hypothetical protein
VACGITAGVGVVVYATDGQTFSWRLVRCFAGFICSMVWIAAIADEVVSVLKVCAGSLSIPSHFLPFLVSSTDDCSLWEKFLV